MDAGVSGTRLAGPESQARSRSPPNAFALLRNGRCCGGSASSPREFGFSTELWTAPRVAELIRRKFRKTFHPHYVNQWLAERRITSQKPERQARERDEREVRRWLREEWPRIKKVPGVGVPIWF